MYLTIISDLLKCCKPVARQWFPNSFKRDPNLNLMNISRPKPKTSKICILRAQEAKTFQTTLLLHS